MQKLCESCGVSVAPSVHSCPQCHSRLTVANQETVARPAETTAPDRSERRKRKRTDEAVAGQTFGSYTLLEEIARGGMGVVFRAKQSTPQRDVALKMILDGQLAGPDEMERFRTEANTVARLEHPGIVPIFEVGEIDGRSFFSMAYVEGGSLKDLIESGPLSNRHAASVIRKVADAVQFAHSRNVIHRDLKPANVLMDVAGEPKVTDFGLAKNIDADQGLTQTGAIMGTPGFMPPEQAEGRMHEVGPLADVYSIGAVLYFLLTGRSPFEGDTVMEVLWDVIRTPPVPPSQLNPEVNPDLETICLKCLRKDPAKRYASAAEISDELERWLGNRAILARPVGRLEKTRLWCRRNPLSFALAALAVLTLVGGTGLSTYFGLSAKAEADTAQENLVLAQTETKRAVAAKDKADRETKRALAAEAEAKRQEAVAVAAREDAEKERLRAVEAEKVSKKEREKTWRALGKAQLALAEAHYQSANTEAMITELNRVPKLLRDDKWRYLQKRADSSLRTVVVPGENGPSGSLRFTAAIPGSNGKFVLSGDSGAFLVEGLSGKIEPLVKTGDQPASGGLYPSAVSPDGNYFVGCNRGTWKLEVYDLRTRGIVSRWSGDGRPEVLFGRSSSTVYTTAPGRTEQRNLMTGEVIVNRKGFRLLAVVPQTEFLIGVGGGELIGLRKLDGEPVWRATGFPDSVQGACTPNGRRFAVLTPQAHIKVFDARPEGPTERTAELTIKASITGQFARLFCTPGNSSVMCVGIDGGPVPIHIWDLESGIFKQSLTGLPRSAQEPAFDPETKLLVAPYGLGAKIFRIPIDVEEAQPVPTNTRSAWSGSDHIWRTPPGEDALALVDSTDPKKVLYRPPIKFGRVEVARDANVAVLGGLSSGLLIVHGAPEDPKSIKIGYHRVLRDLAVSPDGKYVAAIEYKGRVTIFDAKTGRGLSETHVGSGGKLDNNHVVFLPQGRVLCLRGSNKVFHMTSCTLHGKDVTQTPFYYGMSCLEISPDGQTVVVGSYDGHLRFYDSATLEQQGDPLRVHDRHVTAMAFHPTAPIIATGSDDLTIRVWNWQERKQVAEFFGPQTAPRELRFDPSGNALLCVDRLLRKWDVRSMVKEQRNPRPNPNESQSEPSTAPE